jgi:hypothetical protein
VDFLHSLPPAFLRVFSPVPGVKVTAVVQGPDASGRLTDDAVEPEARGEVPLEEWVRRFVERESRRRAATLETETGADGAYAFEGLPSARVHVSARKDGYGIEGARTVRPDATVDFRATAQGRLEATLVLPDGRAPRSAQLIFSRGRSRDSRAWTPARPTVPVPPGTYQVSALVHDPRAGSDGGDDAALEDAPPLRSGPRYTSPPQRVEVAAGASPARDPRSSRRACATPGACRSTAPPAASGSATSARARARR